MPAITDFPQEFHKVPGVPDINLGVHRVTLVSASDTITVSKLANTTSNASSAQVRDRGEGAVTVTDNGANTVTIAGGTAGNVVTIVTLHRYVNLGAEA